ncbi:MAG: Asp-tRNA(Asn)/Glu-tRNA(Gln) amidotransferase subunit GatA [Clostridia bacterium]|nr:Asp-tRNA(Asn)/Glu-tRNA(Gln) amidotransferase subunit GatA [Clostridia bacterium]
MNFHLKSFKELRYLLDNHDITAVELTQHFLARAKKVEGEINSYITLCEKEALEQAEAAQKRIDAGDIAPMTGIPVAIKDNICTKGVRTSCGSKMLDTFIAPYDATVVAALKAQGAVILGKNNMDEFAMGASTTTSYYGTCRNPYDISRVPGGSSGGSAACVSAGLAPASLGSDTGGSIRQPASFCGVTGLKPTYGRVSRYGLVAFASSLDQIGPIAKSARDCAYLLDAITYDDGHDMTLAKGLAPLGDIFDKDISGKKIGLPKEFFAEGIAPQVKEAVMSAVLKYKEMGCEIVDVSLPSLPYAIAAYYLIASAEASSNLARYDGVKYGHRSGEGDTFEEVLINTRNEGFGDEVKRRILLGTYALSSGYFDAYYKKATLLREKIRKEYEAIFEECDVILTPTAPDTAFKIGEKSDDPTQMYLADICTVTVNIAGLPAISVPCGNDSEGMPIGFSLVGKAFDEAVILNMADKYERVSERVLSDYMLQD